jgi:tetratricopeptide (TPR) repeat protein
VATAPAAAAPQVAAADWKKLADTAAADRRVPPEKVLGLYSKVVELDPTSADAWAGVSLALAQMGRLPQAVAAAQRGLAMDAWHPRCLQYRGATMGRLGDHAGALEAYTLYATAHPSDPVAWTGRAGALVRLSRFDEGIAALTRALELEPTRADIWLSRAELEIKLNRPEAARTSLERLLTLDAPPVVRERAEALLREVGGPVKKPAPAAAAPPPARPPGDPFKEALERGDAFLKQNKASEALVEFDRAVAAQPQSANAWYKKGLVLFALRRDEEAIAPLRKSLELVPGHAWTLDTLGRALHRLRRPADALACFEQILARPQEDRGVAHRALIGKALALRVLDRLEEALAVFDQALAVKPEDADVKRERAATADALARR